LQDSITNPRRAVDVNIGGTLNILEACRKNKIDGLVLSSTSSVYGLTDILPITEDQKENCLNPYASTKYAAELLIKNYNKLYGIKACILRYFNVFGERAPVTGQYALVTGIFLRQKKNNEPLSVVGTGLQERDFIYVKDIVSANIMCLQNWNTCQDITQANVFNIGSGKTINILNLATHISNDIIFIPERQGEAKNNLSSYDKFFKLIGWKPTIDILEWIKR
jgi:UDP-glucose 4-epimerase